MNSLSRGSGFSPPMVIESPARRRPRAPAQQVAPLGELEQIAHPRVGGELRLVGQQLRAAQHDGVGIVATRSKISSPSATKMLSSSPPSGRSAGVAQPLAQRGPDLAQREPGEPLVQDPGDLVHRGRRATLRRAPPRRWSGRTPLRRLNTSSRRSEVTGTSSSRSSTTSSSAGRHRHAQLLGQHAEHLGGAAQDLLDRVARAGRSSRRRVSLRLVAGRRQPHELVDVEPVAPIGRDPAGRGVGVKEVALVLQLAHGVADRGRGHAEAEPAGDRLAPGRLRGLDVGLDDRLEHPQFPVGQLV